MPKLLTDMLEQNVRRYPDRPALTMRMGYRTVSLTYAQTHELSRRVAGFLARNGVGRGDAVLILAPNSPYWIGVYWGTLLHGAVVIPLNIQSTEEMIAKIARATGAKLLFRHVHLREKVPADVHAFDIEFLPELVSNCEPAGPAAASPEDTVQIMYTSGTTGEPKGVVLTHANLLSNVLALSGLVPIGASDRFLSVLPLSHIFEQTAGFLMPYLNGAQIIYAHSPAAIRALMQEFRITVMAGVPEFLQVVMSRIEAGARERGREKLLHLLRRLSLAVGIRPFSRLMFSSVLKQFGGKLRLIASGGAPLDPELEQKWNALGVTLLQGYGLTETSPVLTTNTFRRRRVGSVGRVLPGVQLKLAEDGEVLARGPGVFSGYFKNEEKTREAFTGDGWFRTGDMGYLDKDGYLFLKGRKKYMIKGPGGQNVYPEDIESELNRLPGVKDSCVIGVEHPDGRTDIHAVILYAPDQTGDPAATAHDANRRLASYQRINRWSVWPQDDFPRSATRKVRKEEVLKWIRSQTLAGVQASAAARTPLVQILADVTGTAPANILPGMNLVRDLHFDSLLRIELVARIEERYGVTLHEASISPETTVADLELMFAKAGPAPKYLHFKQWPLSWWARAIRTLFQALALFPFYRLFLKVRVKGLENLKDLSLPAVFMPNHISYLDSLIMLRALPWRIRRRVMFAAAVDVAYAKYRRTIWLAELLANPFPFPRQEGENINEGLEYMGRLLDAGWSVVVYPEGRITTDPGRALQSLKRGAGLVAVQMDAPVVPVKISDPGHALQSYSFWPRRRGTIQVQFGRPATFSRRQSYVQATQTLQKALEQM